MDHTVGQRTPVKDRRRAAPSVFSGGRKFFSPVSDSGQDGRSGLFFALGARPLQAADYLLVCHIQASDLIDPASVVLTFECIDKDRPSAAPLAQLQLPLSRAINFDGEPVRLEFRVGRPTRVVIRGHTSDGLGRIHVRHVEVFAPQPGDRIWHPRMPKAYRDWPDHRVRALMIGTNGVCNASCPSCPTNKAVRHSVPSGLMSMSLFTKIIDSIAEGEVELRKNKIGLGLFGEPLMDPLLADRVCYIRSRLPRVKILLNTNAGPFTERRHAALLDMVDVVSIHVEALSPPLYAELMSPLRAELVYPKIERMIALARGRVRIACPISQGNAHEFNALRDYWLGKGAIAVSGISLHNRTTDSIGFYEKSLGPMPMACSAAITRDLVVDWDGTILACCQDFMRREPLGDLTGASVVQALQNRPRKMFRQLIGQRRWNSLQSCRNCKKDAAGADEWQVLEAEPIDSTACQPCA